MKRDELEQLARGAAEPHLAAVPPRGELEPRERVDRDGVDARRRCTSQSATSAPALREQRADAVAQPGQVGARDRARDRERDRGCGSDGHHR